MKYNIGVDLGGTYTKAGIINIDGKIILSSSFPTPKNSDSIVEAITDNILRLITQKGGTLNDINSIGIGCAGPIKSTDGIVESLTNLPVKNFDLCGKLTAKLTRLGAQSSIPIKLINDADAAAFAEYRFGAGIGFAHMALITVGTGVGCGIIINGKVYRGGGTAGEIGHTVIMADGKRCGGCGKKGCLEAYASISALIKNAARLRARHKESMLNNYGSLDGRTIFDCYYRGDISATKAVSDFIHYLSIGIINLYNTVNPEVIVVGGGISKLGDGLIGLIKSECEKLSSLKGAEVPCIKHAELYNGAGIIGAAIA